MICQVQDSLIPQQKWGHHLRHQCSSQRPARRQVGMVGAPSSSLQSWPSSSNNSTLGANSRMKLSFHATKLETRKSLKKAGKNKLHYQETVNFLFSSSNVCFKFLLHLFRAARDVLSDDLNKTTNTRTPPLFDHAEIYKTCRLLYVQVTWTSLRNTWSSPGTANFTTYSVHGLSDYHLQKSL